MAMPDEEKAKRAILKAISVPGLSMNFLGYLLMGPNAHEIERQLIVSLAEEIMTRKGLRDS